MHIPFVLYSFRFQVDSASESETDLDSSLEKENFDSSFAKVNFDHIRSLNMAEIESNESKLEKLPKAKESQEGPDQAIKQHKASLNYHEIKASGDDKIESNSKIDEAKSAFGETEFRESPKKKRRKVALREKNGDCDTENLIPCLCLNNKNDNPDLLKGNDLKSTLVGLPIGKRKRHSNGICRSTRNHGNIHGNFIHDPNKLSPLSLLSDEIVVKIFEFVPRTTLINGCALACKRLKNICYDEALWKRVDLGGKKLGPGQGGKIMLRGTKVLRMAKTTVCPPLFLNESFITSLSTNCPAETDDMGLRLNYLDLSYASIEETCLKSLFKRCCNLRKVALENCKINQSILFHLSQNKNLNVLHMAMAHGVTARGLSHLAQGLTDTLVDVNLSWIGMDHEMVDEAMVLLANNSNTLTRLNIAGCKESLTDGRLHSILGSTKVKQRRNKQIFTIRLIRFGR